MTKPHKHIVYLSIKQELQQNLCKLTFIFNSIGYIQARPYWSEWSWPESCPLRIDFWARVYVNCHRNTSFDLDQYLVSYHILLCSPFSSFLSLFPSHYTCPCDADSYLLFCLYIYPCGLTSPAARKKNPYQNNPGAASRHVDVDIGRARRIVLIRGACTTILPPPQRWTLLAGILPLRLLLHLVPSPLHPAWPACPRPALRPWRSEADSIPASPWPAVALLTRLWLPIAGLVVPSAGWNFAPPSSWRVPSVVPSPSKPTRNSRSNERTLSSPVSPPAKYQKLRYMFLSLLNLSWFS